MTSASGIDTTTAGVPITAEQREQFERDGYLYIRGALADAQIETAQRALADAHRQAERDGALDSQGAVHQLSAVAHRRELAFLLDHPATFGLVWSMLGWNVHVYHSHYDVHPPYAPATPHWGWHQDGGRQNRELETDPRPRLSVKLAYWLSDVSVAGRGNLMIVPGSHRTNWLPGPPRRDLPWGQPAGAIPVIAEPGDALFFDRRIWHNRSVNGSDLTRMAIFYGYTYRWIAIRDELDEHARDADWWHGLSDVQRQLLGGSGTESGDHRWGHNPQQTPVYRLLRDAGRLDPSFAPLIPDAVDAR